MIHGAVGFPAALPFSPPLSCFLDVRTGWWHEDTIVTRFKKLYGYKCYLSLLIAFLLVMQTGNSLWAETVASQLSSDNFVSRPNLVNLMPFLRGLEAEKASNNQDTCLRDMTCLYRDDLPGLIGYVAISAPAIAQSVAELNGAEAGFEESRWAFAPTPSVTVDSALEKNGDDLSFNLDQPLWTGGQLTANLDRSRAQVDYARANVRGVQFQLAQNTIETYGSWLSAWLRYQAWLEGVRAHDDLVDLVKRRVEGGASGRNELLLAQNRRANMQTEVISTQASRDLALAQLEQLLGLRPNETAMTMQVANAWTLPNEISSATEHALEISPFVKQAADELAIVRSSDRAVRAGVMPTLSLHYQYLKEDVFSSHSIHSSTLSLRLSSNFGPGLSRLAQRDQSVAAIRAAEEGLAGIRRDVLEQIWSTFALLQNAQQRSIALEGLVVGSEELFSSYERQFRSGRRSWMDVMNSAREVADNRATLADARATEVTTSWKLALFLYGLEALVAGDTVTSDGLHNQGIQEMATIKLTDQCETNSEVLR